MGDQPRLAAEVTKFGDERLFEEIDWLARNKKDAYGKSPVVKAVSSHAQSQELPQVEPHNHQQH